MNAYEANNITIPDGSVKRILDMNGVILWKKKEIDYTEPFYVENISSYNRILTIAGDAQAPSFEIFYSRDKRNWSSLGWSYNLSLSLSLTPGDKVYLRASTTAWSNHVEGSPTFEITMRGVPKVGGNIMSLLKGSSFSGNERVLTGGYNFSGLFRNATDLVDAGSLLLPATTLTIECYYEMFFGCTNLINAPYLPAATLMEACYCGMFSGCVITKIKCNAINISAYDCTLGWVNGLPNNGVFFKNTNATWVTGDDGIPSGWTIVDL